VFIDDVPILVETPSRPFFPMVRCFYIAVQFDTPGNGWTLELGGKAFSIPDAGPHGYCASII
jgi:hypothetical protein